MRDLLVLLYYQHTKIHTVLFIATLITFVMLMANLISMHSSNILSSHLSPQGRAPDARSQANVTLAILLLVLITALSLLPSRSDLIEIIQTTTCTHD